MHFTSLRKKIIRRFPSNSMVRKLYNKEKVVQYSKSVFSDKQVYEAEIDENQKRKMLSEYRADHPQEYASENELITRLIGRAPAYRQRQNDQSLKDEMLFCSLAYGFHPEEFLCYELEGKSAKQRKQYASSRNVTEYVFRMNDRFDFSVFNDKAKTYQYFGKYFCRDAVSIAKEEDYQNYCSFVAKHNVFVKKKVNEAMGRSVELIDLNEYGDKETFFHDHIAVGKHLLEERIIQAPEMAVFNESSVNTIRCITFYTRKGISVPYCFMKCGRKGSFVDNGGAGGILVGIDTETGKLNTDGFDEFHVRYPAHPDSNVSFNGYQLPYFSKAIELAKVLSAQCPSVKFVGWDFAYTYGQWVVVEGNGMSQLIGPQIVYERGIRNKVVSIMKDMDLIVKKGLT